jgi:hypothetical protein
VSALKSNTWWSEGAAGMRTSINEALLGHARGDFAAETTGQICVVHNEQP